MDMDLRMYVGKDGDKILFCLYFINIVGCRNFIKVLRVFMVDKCNLNFYDDMRF